MHHNKAFQGHGGKKCTVDDIQRANAVANALQDDRYPANQVVAALLVLLGKSEFVAYKKVELSCTPENIQSLLDEVKKRLQPMIDADKASVSEKFGGPVNKFMSNSFTLNTFAEVLRNKRMQDASTGRMFGSSREGWFLFDNELSGFLAKNGYPSPRPILPLESDYRVRNGYNRANIHNGKSSVYEWVSSVDPEPKSIPYGYKRWGEHGIEFDWFSK